MNLVRTSFVHMIKMGLLQCLFYVTIFTMVVATEDIYETDMNFRVDAGTRTCFFENGKAGQVMELIYQVLDGQHGDLDISFDVFDPVGTKIISDYKKAENSIIMDLEHDGDYVFCLDNTYSMMNSKVVFVYVVIENRHGEETEVTVSDENGNEQIVEWVGTNTDGTNYTVEVTHIINSLTRTLHYVARARYMLDMYSANKSKDSHLAFKDTFIVDIWSAFQIIIMICVGLVQVYMIKKLFDRPYVKKGNFI